MRKLIILLSALCINNLNARSIDSTTTRPKNYINFLYAKDFSYGGIGLGYTRTIINTKRPLYLKSGIGFNLRPVLGLGIQYQFCSFKYLNLKIAGHYSYLFSGQYSFRYENAPKDVYSISNCNYLIGNASIEFHNKKSEFGISFNLGYSYSISPIRIQHLSGNNSSYNRTLNLIEGGFCLGVELSFSIDINKDHEK